MTARSRRKSPYTENGAQCIFVCEDRPACVGESKDGRHYTDSIPYESQRLFYELRYMDMCRKYINGLSRTREEEEVQELTT